MTSLPDDSHSAREVRFQEAVYTFVEARRNRRNILRVHFVGMRRRVQLQKTKNGADEVDLAVFLNKHGVMESTVRPNISQPVLQV